MELNGREIRLLFSVGAKYRIEQVNAEDLFMRTVKSAVIASEAFEKAKEFKEPGYKGRPLTEDEVMCLDDQQFEELCDLIAASFEADKKTTVEVEQNKKKEGSS